MRGNRVIILCFGGALCLALANRATAGIVGSTFDFSTAVTGSHDMLPLGGPTTHTDPATPAFCVGPPVDCDQGAGLFGRPLFADVNPTLSTITFAFFGSGGGGTPGTFEITLGNFSLALAGKTITGVTYDSGNLTSGDFTNVVWDGTNATFTGTGDFFNAFGGQNVVFNVTQIPEPSSVILLGAGALMLCKFRRRCS